MIRDIFDREIYVGDFVYAKRESSDGVSTDDMCLVIGENLALSPIVTASFYDTQAKNIIFWFTSALLIKDKNLIERQRWNFLKCRQEHVEYEGGLYERRLNRAIWCILTILMFLIIVLASSMLAYVLGLESIMCLIVKGKWM